MPACRRSLLGVLTVTLVIGTSNAGRVLDVAEIRCLSLTAQGDPLTGGDPTSGGRQVDVESRIQDKRHGAAVVNRNDRLQRHPSTPW